MSLYYTYIKESILRIKYMGLSFALYQANAKHLYHFNHIVSFHITSFLYLIIYCVASQFRLPDRYVLVTIYTYLINDIFHLHFIQKSREEITNLIFYLALITLFLVYILQYFRRVIRNDAQSFNVKNTTFKYYKKLFITPICHALLKFVLIGVIVAYLGMNVQSAHDQRIKTIHLDMDQWLTSKKLLNLIQVEDIKRKGSRYFLTFSLFQSSSNQYTSSCCLLITEQLPQGVSIHTKLWFKGKLTPLAPTASQFDFDYHSYAHRRDIYYQAYGDILLHRTVYNLYYTMQYLRTLIYERFNTNRHADTVMIGTLLGDSSYINPHFKKRMMQMGLGHLLAVSGLHIGCFALIIAWLTRMLLSVFQCARPYLYISISTILGTYVFVALTQWSLSAQRAACMLTILAISRSIKVKCNLYQSIIITAFLMLINDASYAQELGIQLSFIAVYALSLYANHSSLYQQWKKDCGRCQNIKRLSYKKLVYDACNASFVASLFTLPVLIWHLGTLNIQSVFFNALCTPLFSLFVFPLSLIFIALSFVDKGFLDVWATLYQWMLDAIMLVPESWVDVHIVGRWMTLPFAFLCLSYICWIWRSRFHPQEAIARHYISPYSLNLSFSIPINLAISVQRRLKYYSLVFLLISVMLWFYIYQNKSLKYASVTALSIGQGDAHLISNGKGGYALFDVGPPMAGPKIVHLLKKMGIDHLDWISISHLHPDHYGGLLRWDHQIKIDQVFYHGRLLKSRAINKGELFKSKPALPKYVLKDLPLHSSKIMKNESWQRLCQVLKENQIPLDSIIASFGKKTTIKWGHLSLDYLLHSPASHLKENDASLALLITHTSPTQIINHYKPQAILLSGDLEKVGEERLRDIWHHKKDKVQLTVWQANHHGSRSSTHPSTLDLLKPRSMLMSLGWFNRFQFPHVSVIKNIHQRKISYWRTDINGHIMAVWKPQGLSVAPMKDVLF